MYCLGKTAPKGNIYMTEFLLTFLNELTIAALAALPVIEFRGAVIYGLYLGMTKPAIGVSALIGCALSSYALIILLEPCYKWLKKRKFARSLITRLRSKINPHRSKLENKLSDSGGFKKRLLCLWSVFLLVTLPLPGMGAFTGASVGIMLKMKSSDLFWAVFLGNASAGMVFLLFSNIFV